MNCTAAPQAAVNELERTRQMFRAATAPSSDGGELITPREWRALERSLTRAYGYACDVRNRAQLAMGAFRRSPDGLREQVDAVTETTAFVERMA